MILAGKLAFPRFMDKNAKSLVKKLLVADLTKRYGCVKGGAQDIKSHKWFTGFDFEALLSRQIPAPIVPQVRLRSLLVREERGLYLRLVSWCNGRPQRVGILHYHLSSSFSSNNDTGEGGTKNHQ